MFGERREQHGSPTENNGYTNILFPSKKEFGVRNYLYIVVSTREYRQGNQDIWRKRKEGTIKIKFLHLSGIISAPSATGVEKTNPAGRDTSRTLGVWPPSQGTAIILKMN